MQFIKRTLLLLAICLSCSSIWAAEPILSKKLTTDLEAAATKLDTKIAAAEALVAASKNSIKQKALTEGVEALTVLKENAEKLKVALAKISTDLGDSLDENIEKTLKDLNTWADEQVARASKTSTKAGINQAKTLTRNVVRSYTTDFPQATRDLNKANTDFEKQVNNAIKTYTTHAKKLFGDMEACEKATTSRCQSTIQGEKVSTSTAELLRLTKLGNKLVDSGTFARGRVAFLIEKSEKDQAKVEVEIDGIIKFQKDPNIDDITTTKQP